MIRAFDIVFSALGLLMLTPLLAVIYFIGWMENGAPLFLQERVGRCEKAFTLIKFRTMRMDALSTPTHLIDPSVITRFGAFLRRTKLDELPQLWNVLFGDMSLVGPRPCLAEQYELVAKRRELGVFKIRPGVTGLAQIQGLDMSNPTLLAEIDAQMVEDLTPAKYFYSIVATLAGKGAGDRVQSKSP